MQLVIHSISKSYLGKSIFKDFDFRFDSQGTYAIQGANGVGKTSLLKLIMGFSKPDKGSIYWEENGRKIACHFTDFAFAGIQLELVEELRVQDVWDFHFQFRKHIHPEFQHVFQEVFSSDFRTKKINQLSAGWYNRLKVLLALFTESKVLILDEPFSNFDDNGITFFSALISQYLGGRMLIVAGNRPDEWALCNYPLVLNKESEVIIP